jgi:hypothetical protein
MLHKEHRWHASTTKSLAFVRAIEAERSGLSQFAKVEYYEMTEGSSPKKPDISSYLSMGSNRTLKNHCVRSKEHQGDEGQVYPDCLYANLPLLASSLEIAMVPQ